MWLCTLQTYNMGTACLEGIHYGRGRACPATATSALLQDFQARMQRCVQRCQDEVQETLPTQPSDREIAKAQVLLTDSASCMHCILN